MIKSRLKKRITWVFISASIFINAIAFFHAWKFTHFAGQYVAKTSSPEKLTAIDKIRTLFFGVSNPRPQNKSLPKQPFEQVKIKSNVEIACWSIIKENSKGTVIIFHGFSGEKSAMLDKSDEFLNLGYSTLLADFMGSGGSGGNQTTLGYKEAEEVKSAFEYLIMKGESKIFLFGTSMGAVAVLKAINDYDLRPSGIIIECPFGSMYETTCARFRIMHAPVFPMAALLVFWGGIQNGFWSFGHNPSGYAKDITCPVLLLYGEKDKNVSLNETQEIYTNLKGKKTLKMYPLAGHENYLIRYKQEWIEDVSRFMETSIKY